MDRRRYDHYDDYGRSHPHYIGQFYRDQEQPYEQMQPHFIRSYAGSSDTGYPSDSRIGRLSLQIPQDHHMSYGSAYHSEPAGSSIFEYDWGPERLHANEVQEHIPSFYERLNGVDSVFRDADGYSNFPGYSAPDLDRVLRDSSSSFPEWALGSEELAYPLFESYPHFW